MNTILTHDIIMRWQSHQSLRGIARDLGVGRERVTRIVRQHQSQRESTDNPHPDLAKPNPKRRESKLDEFAEAIQKQLSLHPNTTIVRMLEELQAVGYKGGYSILRERMNQLQVTVPQQPTVRFETPPGRQAQMDWSDYEIAFSQEGRRRVNLFSYILSYSRRQYLYFTERQNFDATIRHHILAFKHLQGVAETCLYDNMKVVVQRWEDDQPVYNTRFLAFATHYGMRPHACRPRRPETKGKVERPFDYVEKNLLNGRTFRSLGHLNEVTRWWLEKRADIRIHRETKKRPVDAHQEELAHLLPLPSNHFDTSRVVYRVVGVEGFIHYSNNHYSVPWRYIGELLPVRIMEDSLAIYNNQIEVLGTHLLFSREQCNQRRLDQAHRPPSSQQEQIALLRQRFAMFGAEGVEFLESLLIKQRCGKHQAQKVLTLMQAFKKEDVRAALRRAIKFHAYSFSALERILNLLATPKSSWELLTEGQQQLLEDISAEPYIKPRDSSEYQHLLFDDGDDHVGPAPTQSPKQSEDEDREDEDREDKDREDKDREDKGRKTQ